MRIRLLFAATASVVIVPPEVVAQPPVAARTYSYADLADRALAAPIALVANITRTTRLELERSPQLGAGQARLLVEATATVLIRGPAGIPPQIRYLADVPLDARGKVPKLKKARVLLLARPVAGKPGELQLVAPDAQFALTPELERRVRAILTEAVRADAPPAITGIASAFHVPGAIPGEGETQIFLSTTSNRPISLNVLRRPGEAPRWSVALGEIVDEAAQTPVRDTLLWYRLACGLPRALPAAATQDLEASAATAARGDYAVVLEQLGPCGRAGAIRTS